MSPDEIEGLPLFQGLAAKDIEPLIGLFRLDSFQEGAVIFAQGDTADRLYVLVSGEVAIRFKPPDGDELTVAVIEPGGVFGWSAALGRTTFTSCALCTQQSEAISVEGDELRLLCETHPRTGVIILERLAGVIAQRLKSTHKHVIQLLRQGMVR
ncbi:MAG: Crp/Fnr family transcriptional regulator [Anaerolineales bacterium]|jgi:CRP-like cAMP-binding protein